ncbi:hypothetical protein AAY473_020170 [Plecturocebus cupreus]
MLINGGQVSVMPDEYVRSRALLSDPVPVLIIGYYILTLWITGAQEFEAAVSYDCTTALQPGRQSKTLLKQTDRQRRKAHESCSMTLAKILRILCPLAQLVEHSQFLVFNDHM